MTDAVAFLLARLTSTIDDLHFTEGHLRTQRAHLRDAATALRLGEDVDVVIARLESLKVWAPADMRVGRPR